MRHLLKQVSLMLTAVFVVSCASAIPLAQIGDYVSSERQAGDEALTRIDQRPLQAGLIVVSDRPEPGADPNLPEEALARLRESLQQDLGSATPVAIKEMIPADHVRPQPHGDWTQFVELGRQRGFDYLASDLRGRVEYAACRSFEQAAKRLVLKLQNSWFGVLESEATARKTSS
jgi:hypothetical protein